MEYRNLEITISSAKDLKYVNLFSKMDVYVVVMIVEDPRSKQRTPTDKDGGKSPKWNHKMRFVVDQSAARQNRSTLLFQVMSDRAFGDKVVGEVYVAAKELLDGSNNDTERMVSYSLTTSSGKAKGTLNLSYKVVGAASNFAAAPNKVDVVSSDFTPNNNKHSAADDGPVMAYPSGPSYPHQPEYPGGYAPQSGYPPPQQGGYPPPQGYPQPGGYPPQPGYGQGGYPAMAPGYGGGYPPPQQAGGYGYPGQKPKKNRMGGMGMGLGAGLLGGLLVGDMLSDVGDMGGGGGFDDMGGGFDF